MKNYISLMRECCLVVALMMAFPFAGKATTASKAFRARASLNKAQAFALHLAQSDTIPLTSRNAVYALGIDATIQQPREASFVRIVLEDTEGHNYLVAESDRFRNDTTTIQLSQYCEETALLGGITPACLKCYLAGDATLTLTGIHTSDEEPMRQQSTSKESATAIKEAQVQDIVDRINAYNVRHGKLWQAGVTNQALKRINELGALGKADAYLANMQYYVGGLYEIGERQRSAYTYQSPYVDSFDWRNRHGKNWITSIKDQEENGPCSIFAAVGATEALTNLYYNDTINLDLSEQFICCATNFPIVYGYFHSYTLDIPFRFISTDSVIDESSCRYNVETDWWNEGYEPRPMGIEAIRLDSVFCIFKGNMSLNAFSDSIKKHIIHDGPCVWGGDFHNSSYNYHYMCMVGYGTVQSGVAYTILNNHSSYTVYADASLVGRPYWICKNSFGNSMAHYINVIFNESVGDEGIFFAKTPVSRRNHTDAEIICEDRDRDGYYNWGISENPPIQLPSWAHNLRDGDDTNRLIGGIDDYGKTIIYGQFDEWLISESTTIQKDTFINSNIAIDYGVTFKVCKDMKMFPSRRLYVAPGATLEIDGGAVIDVILETDPGSIITIKNGGQLILIPNEDENDDIIHLQQGAILNFNSGMILKSDAVLEGIW